MGLRRYELTIDRSTEGAPGAQVRAARPRVSGFEQGFVHIVEAIASEMLELYNTTWRVRGRELSRARFAKRLRLEAAHITSNRTTLYVNAGGLFTDHAIEVRLGADGTIREILLAG